LEQMVRWLSGLVTRVMMTTKIPKWSMSKPEIHSWMTT